MIPKIQMILRLKKNLLKLKKQSQVNHLVQNLRKMEILQMIPMILKKKQQLKNLEILKMSHLKIIPLWIIQVQMRTQHPLILAKHLPSIEKMIPKNPQITSIQIPLLPLNHHLIIILQMNNFLMGQKAT